MKRLINTYSPKTNKIEDGIFNQMNEFCFSKISLPKCAKFYDNLLQCSDDIYQCPYGFSCIKHKDEIYNCLLLKEKYSNKKMKDKKAISQKVFTAEEIMKLIEIDEEILKYTTEYEQLYGGMSDFLHDITKANVMIDKHSKNITKTNFAKKDIENIKSIYHLSDFITKRIELYRMSSNTEIIKTGRLRKRDAYKLWDIYRHIFYDFCKESQLSINMGIYNMECLEDKDKNTTFYANDSITILPYLLIDNAVKYSKAGSKINIEFYQDNGILNQIIINSVPSYKITENPNLFFNRGYRASNNTSKSSGSGLGLDIVKQICDYNNIKVSIDVESEGFETQKFVVILKFNE